MTAYHDHPTRTTHTTTEDEAFLAGARCLLDGLQRHPFVMGFLAVVAAAILFWMGLAAGETIYLAFDDGLVATVFVGAYVTMLLAIVAVGVWLDRRQRGP